MIQCDLNSLRFDSIAGFQAASRVRLSDLKPRTLLFVRCRDVNGDLVRPHGEAGILLSGGSGH